MSPANQKRIEEIAYKQFERVAQKLKTREHSHWIQRITFAAETNAALRRAVTAERTHRHTTIPYPLAAAKAIIASS